ncbi:MAG: hypothetical protein ACRDT8_10705 [Micromonosporaceae bacterium]
MSLDDLLTVTPEYRPPDRHRLTPVRLIKIMVGSAVLAFAANQLLQIFVGKSSYPLVLSVVMALWLAGHVTAAAGGAPVQRGAGRALRARGLASGDHLDDDPSDSTPGGGKSYGGVRRWVGRLGHVNGDLSSFRQLVQPMIVAVIDERLRLVHGVSRQRDPQRVRELLSDPLWIFVTEPARRVPKPAQLVALAEQIEKI